MDDTIIEEKINEMGNALNNRMDTLETTIAQTAVLAPSNLHIVSLVYKINAKDYNLDIALENIQSLESASANEIRVYMENGHSFPCVPKIGIQLSKLWAQFATNPEEVPAISKLTVA